jgi:hypothetical protein
MENEYIASQCYTLRLPAEKHTAHPKAPKSAPLVLICDEDEIGKELHDYPQKIQPLQSTKPSQ